ncbi:MAG: SDR family oxidoreductase [Gammaproteobacteria bacterium]|nr:SDR family oxidoreductase [Gammaproteobacteria bacterium]MCP5202527.1 SDR family oxidoreductase [Gammaproteobacteria bacterium]
MSKDLFDLSGKVALITGGSRGLGRQMALAFAERGADVAIVSRKLDKCEEVAREVEALGRRALPYACHLGRWADLEPMVEAVYDHFGRVDILVNNAGMSPLYPSLDQVTEELFDKVVALNLKAPFRLMALVGKRMMEGEGGNVINISSTAAMTPSPGSQPYGAAKAGLNMITGAFAHAYGPKVRVNCIMCGPFLTDISKAWDMDAFAKRAERMALRRGGEPEEIVGAALYFASAASSFATGAVLAVDGGWLGSED